MPVPPLFFIVPLTPGISIWISTKVEFYCISAYPVLHKGPSLNLRREVFILWHSVTCVNTWIISDGLNDGRIFTPRRQVTQEGNSFLSPQSVTVLAGVKPRSAHTFQSKTQEHVDQNVAPFPFRMKSSLPFLTHRCTVKTVRHLVWWSRCWWPKTPTWRSSCRFPSGKTSGRSANVALKTSSTSSVSWTRLSANRSPPSVTRPRRLPPS